LDIEYMVFGYGIYLMAVHHVALHWHMELCLEHMVPTVPVQHRLLGITMQLHTLLGMKAGDLAFAPYYYFLGFCIALAYGVMSPLLSATVPVQHRLLGITMQLHTLLGMKAGDMTFTLHMHYDFGLWYICFGFRILERY